MKTVVALSIGFWLGREVYLNYDRNAMLKKEAALKKRIADLLRNTQRHKMKTNHINS